MSILDEVISDKSNEKKIAIVIFLYDVLEYELHLSKSK